MTTGRVVLLNGAPRAGKSSIARALQGRGAWINLGVDAQNASLPAELFPGIGLRPGGERPELEPTVRRLYAALWASVAAHARQGFDVVADVGLHDSYSVPLGTFDIARRGLGGLPVLFVGVMCPIEIIMARRNADPQGGRYTGGAEVPAPVQRWQDAAHRGHDYDLTLDTSVQSPEASAEAILGRLGLGLETWALPEKS